jgi:phosphomannomutase
MLDGDGDGEADEDMGAEVVVFDLDGTLAESKSAISDRMAALLVQLLSEVEVCIISGGGFEQLRTQVLDHLHPGPGALARLHLMPTCGTRYYRWVRGAWRVVYAHDMSQQNKLRVINALTDGAKELGLWEPEPWGEVVEDRGSQITFSALGQAAPAGAKKNWDPDGSKKERLRAYAARRLPDLEVRSGGSTSVDVTGKGIDKAYGIRKLISSLDVTLDDLLFIGDRLDPGGNDYPVKAMGVRCVAVSRWQDTADYLDRLLDSGVRSSTAPG